MPKEFSRTLRIGEQIQRELAVLIQQEIKDPRLGMVTVSGVEVSADLAQARAYVTTLTGGAGAQETVKILNRAAGFLRRELARRLALRGTPALHFHYDDSVERGAAISAAIDRSLAAQRDEQGRDS